MLERKFTLTGDRTHNHQVMSLTCSLLSHPKTLLNSYFKILLPQEVFFSINLLFFLTRGPWWSYIAHLSTKQYRLTHYHTTNFRLFQTERASRRQFQIWRKWKKGIQTGGKHCGKRRNCSLRAISPSPTVFSKGLFPRGIKRCQCVGMG